MTPVTQPRVSVLIPVYDAAAWLPACLRSVARQTLRDWECVLVDDGSTDASLAVARDFVATDPRFRVLSLPHRGLVSALNVGLEECRADVVARMDADDLMHRQRLALQLDALHGESRLDAVGCGVRLFPRAALGDGMRAYERWLLSIDSPEAVTREQFVECPVAHPALAIRRSVLRELGYRDRGWPEDYDLLLRLLASGRRVGSVPRRLLAWRQREGRLSRCDPRYATERFTACKASFLAAGFLKEHAHYVLWGYGGTGRGLRKALIAHGRQPSAIVELHPRRIGNRIHGAPVLPPEALATRDREPLIVSVAGAEARGLIRQALAGLGYAETVDFVCAA